MFISVCVLFQDLRTFPSMFLFRFRNVLSQACVVTGVRVGVRRGREERGEAERLLLNNFYFILFN